MIRFAPVVARILVPLVLLTVIWTLADARATLQRLRALHWEWVVLAFCFANVQTVLSAVRWMLVSNRLGAPLDIPRAVAEYYLAQLVNQSVPGGVVGDAARAVRARGGGGLSRAAQAVVIERLAGQIFLWSVLALGLVASLVLPGGVAMPLEGAGPALTLFATLCGLIVVAVAVRRRIDGVRRFGAAIHTALLAPGAREPQVALGLAIVAVNLASFAFAARATGTVLPLEAVLTLVPLILTAMLIPLTVAGWGYREGAAAALFPLVSASAAAGLAASLIFGLVVLAASLPGVLVLLRRQRAAANA